MAEVSAYHVKEVLGMQATEDGKHMLVALRLCRRKKSRSRSTRTLFGKLWIASLTLHR